MRCSFARFLTVTAIAATISVSAVVTPAHAQSAVDSVKMERGPVIHFEDNKCWWGAWARWSDAKARVLGVDSTSYADYRKVDAEGNTIVPAYGQSYSNFNYKIPKGYFGMLRSLGGSSGSPKGPSPRCWSSFGHFTSWLASQPDWYAVYSLDDGTPIAEFAWEQRRKLIVDFDGSFPDYSREVETPNKKPVASYEWDFGDNSATVTGATPSHEYAEPGQYFVTLKVTDDDGDEATVTHEVTVRSVVLEHRIFTAQRRVSTGDTLRATTVVTNVGVATAAEVNVSRGLTTLTSFPESDEANSRDAEWDTLTPLTDSTFTDVGVDETISLTEKFIIEEGAEARIDSAWVPVPVDWVIRSLAGGFDEDGLPAEVHDLCDSEVACTPDNETRVENKPLEVDLLVKTAAGDAVKVRSGLARYASDTFPNGLFRHLVRPNPFDELQCNSGCVDINVQVVDETGAPLEGAVVELSRLLVDTDLNKKSIVTPNQGGGVFEKNDEWGRVMTLPPTDAEGKQSARFWMPGVIHPVDAYVTARATKEGYNVVEEEQKFEMIANRVDVVKRTAHPRLGDYNFLTPAKAVQNLSEWSDLPGWCTWGQGLLVDEYFKLGGHPIDGFFKRQLASQLNFLCTDLLTKYIYDEEFALAHEVKPRKDKSALHAAFSQTMKLVALYWFTEQFEFSLAGSAEISPTLAPPFFAVDSELSDQIDKATRAIAWQYFVTGTRARIDFDLYEVSHYDLVGDWVESLYMDLSTRPDQDPKVAIKKLITKNYNSKIFLTQDPVESTLEASTAGDESITVETTPGKNAVAATQPFVSGHVLAVHPGTGREELVQVASVNGSTLTLTAPLKFAHNAGTAVGLIDSLALTPPLPPTSTMGASGLPGSELEPELTWFSVQPAASFDIDVATDSLFTDVVQSYEDLTEPEVRLDELTDRTRYYWRVAATNSLGQGEWSSTYSFFTGQPRADDLAEAHVIEDKLDVARFVWHYAATSETDEVEASCGSGGNSLWFSYTPTTSGTVALETFDSGHNTVLSVWTGTSHPLTEVACNNDYTDVLQSYVEFQAEAGTTYLVRVVGLDDQQGHLFLNLRAPTQVGTEDGGRDGVSLLALDVYPNPAGQEATVAVEIPAPADVVVEMFDLLGRKRAVVANGHKKAGTHRFALDPLQLPNGVYVVRVVANGDAASATFVVAK